MPTFVGNSSIGLQLLGTSVPPDDGYVSIVFNGLFNPDRLERVGTLLITNSFTTPAQHRVLAVHKLYGHGLITPPLAIVTKFNVPVQVWVNWFRPSLGWRMDTT